MAQDDPFAAIKIVNDAFIFANKEGFPALKVH
jgi:hypothetical protein